MKLEAYARPNGVAWFDDVRVERQLPTPVDVFMLYPNYRGMLFEDQSQTMRFAIAVTPPVADFARYRVVGNLREEGGIGILAQQFAASASFVAELDGGLMSPGRTYLVTFSLIDGATGATVYTYPAHRVSKVSAATKQAMNIAVDEKNRLLVHGTPRFLLGVYDAGSGYGTTDSFWEDQLWSPTSAAGRRMESLRINFYLNYWYGTASATAMNALMSNLGRRGIMYLQTGNCFDTKPASAGAFLIDTSDSYVQTLAMHPQSAGYYVIDECVAAMLPGAFAQYQRLRRLDPDSMTSAVLLPAADVVLWRDAADVISTDPYPMYGAEATGGYPHSRVADAARLTRDAVRGARPWMTVLQFFKFTSQGRWPTLAEMRSHAYMAIVEGAHGLWWWSLGTGALKDVCSGWCDQKTQLMGRLRTVVNEIAALEPVLLADDAPWALGGVSSAAIQTKVKVVDGKGYVFAYNYANAAVTATFSWSNGTPGAVTVNAENRALTPTGATFTDTFAPYEAHVYVVENAYPRLTTTIMAPADGASVTGTVSIDAASSGGRPGPRTFAVAVTGPTAVAPMVKTVNATSTSFTWDTSAVANGTYTLTLTTTDAAGASASAQRAVTVAKAGSAVPNPVPVLNGLAPSSATAGDAGFNVLVTGSGFTGDSIVRWNGATRTTTFVGAAELRAAIPASDVSTAGTAQVTVFTPTPGGGSSAQLPFAINAAAGSPAPML